MLFPFHFSKISYVSHSSFVIAVPEGSASDIQQETRYLGLIVCRGPGITVVGPDDGMIQIDNPFLGGEAEGEEAQ